MPWTGTPGTGRRTSIDWPVALAFAGAAFVAALLAGRFGSRVDPDRLRRWLAWLIIAVAGFVAVEAITNPGALG